MRYILRDGGHSNCDKVSYWEKIYSADSDLVTGAELDHHHETLFPDELNKPFSSCAMSDAFGRPEGTSACLYSRNHPSVVGPRDILCH
jgi:hypothetical protein